MFPGQSDPSKPWTAPAPDPWTGASGGGGGNIGGTDPAEAAANKAAGAAAAAAGAPGHPGASGGPNYDIGSYLSAITGDPFYMQMSAYLTASGTLDKATLDQMINIANQKNALSTKRIKEQEVDAHRNFTNDLGARWAIESGDTAFGHNKIATTAAEDMQAAQLELMDYLAGVQAAYAQRELDRQRELAEAQFMAAQRQMDIWNATHPVPEPA